MLLSHFLPWPSSSRNIWTKDFDISLWRAFCRENVLVILWHAWNRSSLTETFRKILLCLLLTWQQSSTQTSFNEFPEKDTLFLSWMSRSSISLKDVHFVNFHATTSPRSFKLINNWWNWVTNLLSFSLTNPILRLILKVWSQDKMRLVYWTSITWV